MAPQIPNLVRAPFRFAYKIWEGMTGWSYAKADAELRNSYKRSERRADAEQKYPRG